jgi:hypothetical protein
MLAEVLRAGFVCSRHHAKRTASKPRGLSSRRLAVSHAIAR